MSWPGARLVAREHGTVSLDLAVDPAYAYAGSGDGAPIGGLR
jgi:hypothetical protein